MTRSVRRAALAVAAVVAAASPLVMLPGTTNASSPACATRVNNTHAKLL